MSMVTEKEMQNCKKGMEAVYGHMNEDELRDQMKNVMDKMSRLYKHYYTNLFAGNERIVDTIDNILHYAHVQMATIAKMLVEAKKQG